MLPLLALPLIAGATSTTMNVVMDLGWGLYRGFGENRWGTEDLVGNGMSFIAGSKNDDFVSCCSEAAGHIIMGTVLAPWKWVQSGANAVRAFGEAYNGDFIDALIHGTTALTGMDSAGKLLGKLADAGEDVAEMNKIAKAGFKEIAEETGTGLGALFKNFFDPLIQAFKKARGAKSGVTEGISNAIEQAKNTKLAKNAANLVSPITRRGDDLGGMLGMAA